MRALVSRFIDDRAGVSAVEYALIAMMASMIGIIGYSSLANSVQDNFQTQGESVNEAWTKRQ